ncbi:MAG: hypothetical protein WC781_03510 [Candidatus Pacearchaeota archaeon]|jgi:hypothetical protein
MKLQDYLQAIRECPDELVKRHEFTEKQYKLTMEFGIYDNWPILLKTDFEQLLDFFKNSKKYTHDETKRYKNPPGICELFSFIAGTVNLQVCNYTSGGKMYGEEVYEIIEKLGYNTRISLHNYQEQKMPVNDMRAIVIVIENICKNYVIPENIPLMFPSSEGWNHLGDISRRVYFPDEDETEMFGSKR